MQGQYEDHTDDEEMEDKENAAPCHMPEMRVTIYQMEQMFLESASVLLQVICLK